jgi:hypothetical protein
VINTSRAVTSAGSASRSGKPVREAALFGAFGGQVTVIGRRGSSGTSDRCQDPGASW